MNKFFNVKNVFILICALILVVVLILVVKLGGKDNDQNGSQESASIILEQIDEQLG